MRWECSECGCRVERPRPPAVCRSCGTAGALFVEADGGIEEDLEAITAAMRASRLRGPRSQPLKFDYWRY